MKLSIRVGDAEGGFTVYWPIDGGEQLKVGPLATMQEVRLVWVAMLVKAMLSDGEPRDKLTISWEQDNIDAEVPLDSISNTFAAVKLEDYAYQLPKYAGRVLQLEGSASTADCSMAELCQSAAPLALFQLAGMAASATLAGMPLLHFAAATADAATLHLLLRALPEQAACRDESGATPLAVAAAHKRPEALQILLKAAPAAAMMASESGRLPLHDAASAGDAECVALLLEAAPGAAQLCTKDCSCAAHFAACHGHNAVIGLLLAAAPDVAWQPLDALGILPAHLAASNGHTAVLQQLLLAAPDTALAATFEGWLPVHYAASGGDDCTDALRVLLEAAPGSVSAQAPDGSTALHLAASEGCTAAIALCLEANSALARSTTHKGRTPLFLAARKGHLEAVRQLLVAAPETAEATAEPGFAPVHIACLTGHLQVLEVLLSRAPHAASIQRGIYGWTALHVCCVQQEVACAQLLCRTLPSMARVRNDGGRTPLAEAASFEAEGLVALLLHAAPETVREQDDEGCLPVHFACKRNHTGILRLLLAAAPDTALALTALGASPLHLCALRGSAACAEVLLTAIGAHLALKGSTQSANLPLHYAAVNNHLGVMRVLLDAAPEAATAQNSRGNTPLEHALLAESAPHPDARQEQPDCSDAVRCLLGYGAGPAVLAALAAAGEEAQPFFADFVLQRQTLTDEEWAVVPTPCPGLRHALPAVLERSTQQALQLVRHLPAEEVQRLRCGALCLARAQRRSRVYLPLPLVWRLLGLCLDD